MDLNTIVFAKMKGFPFWPGIVYTPPAELLKSSMAGKPGYYCIRFFGSGDFSWIEENKIKRYDENKHMLTGTKTTAFKKACDDLINFIGNGCKFPPPEEPVKQVKKERCSMVSIRKKIDSLPKRKQSRVSMSALPDKKKAKLSGLSIAEQIEKEVELQERLENPKRSENLLGFSNLSVTEITSDDPLVFPSTSFSSKPDPPVLDVLSISETLVKKKIDPSGLKFGFLGLGNMGSGLVKNLLNSKHSVTVWNRTSERCQAFVEAGVLIAETPMDVVAQTDVTFCCVSDNDAARMLALGNCGAIHEMKPGKAYVEMSGVDKATSQTIANAVTASGGRYLEARFQGLKSDAEEGTLNLFAAGDRSLYDDCNSCFAAFSKEQTFLGVEVGKASALYLEIQSALGTAIVHLSEVLFMAENYQLPVLEVLKTFREMDILNPFLHDMALKAYESNDGSTQMSIKNLQKDMHLTLMQASGENRSLPLVAMANEYLKNCRQMGYEDRDVGNVLINKRP